MNKRCLLAVESSTSQCSIAIYHNGACYEKVFTQPRKHLEQIYLHFPILLKEAGCTKDSIEGVVVGQGPGQFTGLRVALGFAQGLAFSLKINMMPVSSLAVLIRAQLKQQDFTRADVIMNARQNHIYLGRYKLVDQISLPVQADCCLTVEDWQKIKPADISFIDPTLDWSNEWVNQMPLRRFLFKKPLASDLIHCALNLEVNLTSWQRPEKVQLNYLRNNVTG